MTNNRFYHLVSLMLQNRRHINSIYQEYSTKKKADGLIVAVVTDTSSTELETLSKEGFKCCIFPAVTFGFIELWIYEI